jgi:hypothetical protein
MSVKKVKINKFGRVAAEWKEGLCVVKCSDDTRSMGGCSCANIFTEKTRDTSGQMPYLNEKVEPQY